MNPGEHKQSLLTMATCPNPSMSAAQETAWIREQREIASRVDVLPDMWKQTSSSSSSTATSQPYCLVSPESAVSGTNMFFGGVDISFPEDDDDLAVAVYTIVDAANSSLEVVYACSEFFALTVPYVSSFLVFREIDPLVRLIEQQQKVKPELTPRAILCDGEVFARSV